jgi:hypothetical protein
MEERRERPCDGGDHEDRPQLEHDVEHAPGDGQRVLQRRGDRQDLHGGEENGLTVGVDVGSLRSALDEPDAERAEEVDAEGQRERDQEPREEPPVTLAPRAEPRDLLVDHGDSFGGLPEIPGDGPAAANGHVSDFRPTRVGSPDALRHGGHAAGSRMTRLDAEKLDTLRRWGEGLQRLDSNELSAAGRAILLLIEEVEHLYVDLWHTRAGSAAPALDAAPEPQDPLAETLRSRIRRGLGFTARGAQDRYPHPEQAVDDVEVRGPDTAARPDRP